MRQGMDCRVGSYLYLKLSYFVYHEFLKLILMLSILMTEFLGTPSHFVPEAGTLLVSRSPPSIPVKPRSQDGQLQVRARPPGNHYKAAVGPDTFVLWRLGHEVILSSLGN